MRFRRTWDAEPPAIYGRFDLAFDDRTSSCWRRNADTPTTLLEASVIQWDWLQARFPHADQFNSLHERLIAKWTDLKPYLTEPLYFAHADQGSGEDLMTATYLRETAVQAGLQTEILQMDQIGWNPGPGFVDLDERPIRSIFKLYPWEWMAHERLARTRWRPILAFSGSNRRGRCSGRTRRCWQSYGNCSPVTRICLPAFLTDPHGLTEYVRKPLLSREGANITVVTAGGTTSTPGDYGEEGFVYQAIAPIPTLDGQRPVLGSWVVDGEPAGMGIRESADLVTSGTSCFVPHLMLPA